MGTVPAFGRHTIEVLFVVPLILDVNIVALEEETIDVNILVTVI